jgi:hypothetical protein
MGNLTVQNTGSAAEDITVTIRPPGPPPPLHPPVSSYDRHSIPVPAVVGQRPVPQLPLSTANTSSISAA